MTTIAIGSFHIAFQSLCTCTLNLKQFITAKAASITDFERHSKYANVFIQTAGLDQLFELIFMLGVYGL